MRSSTAACWAQVLLLMQSKLPEDKGLTKQLHDRNMKLPTPLPHKTCSALLQSAAQPHLGSGMSACWLLLCV
jgi:hypothetical protein